MIDIRITFYPPTSFILQQHNKITYLNGEISLEAGVERDARYE